MKLLFSALDNEKQIDPRKHLPKRLTLNITYSTGFPSQTTVNTDTAGLQKMTLETKGQ